MAEFSSDVQTFTNNYLDYSKVSFEEVTYELGRILKLKSNNLQDFYRSSLGRRVSEAFASTLNVDWKYLEAQFRESFLVSAQNYSSIISSANSQHYSIRRPTSAKSSFNIELTGAVGSYNGKIVIPKFSTLSYSGVNFITLDDYTFNWDYTGTIVAPTGGAKIIQGEFKIRRFLAQEKKKFQRFTFNDPTFSDYFGDNDVMSNEKSLLNRITAVTVDGEPYEIDRRTLSSSNKDTTPYIDNGVLVESRNKKCLIRTINNGNIEIIFGDGIISEIPRGVVEIRYLSSKGASGNIFNSKSGELTYGGPEAILYDPNTIDNSNVKIYLENSPIGGDDIESIESVKMNAPSIFASLDRYVTANDYIAGLKTSEGVKYAIAYGEDDIEPGDYRYFNVVQYSILKNIYLSDASSSNLVIAKPSEYVFSGISTIDNVRKMQDESGWPSSDLARKYDLSYLNNELDDQAKYNYYVETYGSVFRLSKQDIEVGSELETINQLLRRKGQLTCRHIYIPPKVHKYKMNVIIYTSPITSKNNLKGAIKQESYQYLKENTHFNFPIYNSKIVKLIEAKTGIVGCHVYFTPSDDLPNDSVYIQALTSNSLSIFNNELLPALVSIDSKYYTPFGSSKLYPYIVDTVGGYEKILASYFCKSGYSSYDMNKMKERVVANFINNIYKETLGRMILNPQLANAPSNITSIITNNNFINETTGENIYDIFVRWAVEFRKDTNYYVALNVITDKGDIANFSIPHEIAQISIDTNDISIETRTN